MAPSTDDSNRPRILVVGGESSVRVLLVSVLAREGWPVLALETADAALEALRQGPAGLIIADRALPGIDLHLRARALHPTLQTILIAPAPSREPSAAAQNEGVREYVIKPFQVEDVLAVCEAAMKVARSAA